MTTAYLTEAHERRYHDRLITIENVTPAYRTWEEREKVKKEIEERLFDVFCKYAQIIS